MKNDSNQTTAEPPASTPTAIPTSSVAATTPTTGATAATDANAASAGTDPYLTELRSIKWDRFLPPNFNKTYEVSGQPYVHSIAIGCHATCTEQQIISYNLGKKYRKLTFGVGIEDNSATREQVAVFTLIDAPIALVRASSSYVRDRRRTTTHTARKIRPSTNAMVGDVAVLNL